MLKYERQTKPGLVALYDIRPGNGAGPSISYNLEARTIEIERSCIGRRDCYQHKREDDDNIR